ncbi:MAG: exosortase/archaeosortase family protein [Planctomycetota bacterium]|nr:exosortase/archaeosortase family protein [Planctomycetota bacterium]
MKVFLAIYLPLVLAFGTALGWCWDMWMQEDGYFAHGILVPFVMAAVFWMRRSSWQRVPARIDARGWLLLGPALLIHLCGAALTIDSMSAAGLVLVVPGAAWLALGRERLRGLWPALWLVAFAVPMSIYLTNRVAFELKEVAVAGGVWLTQVTGLAVERVGAFLYVPGQEEALNVADPCGGLRSLLAMVTLVYCLAFFTGPPNFFRRAILLAAAAPLALFVNMVRISGICWLANFYDVELASGTGHDVLNGVAWIIDLLLILGLDHLISSRLAPSSAATPAESAAPAPSGSLRLHGTLLWLLAGPLLVLSVYRPYTESAGRAEGLPPHLGGFVRVQEYPLTDRHHELLGTDDATWLRYVTADDESLFVYGVFHASNWKSVHPPHICLRGSNMSIDEDGVVDLLGPDSELLGTAGYIVLRSQPDDRPYVSLYAYGARGLCTGSYAQFFLHHAPRALLRSSNDGFLLRVESWADGPGGIPAARDRCRELLAMLVSGAHNLLPE